MAAFDSSVRLKQLNQPEVSGFILQVIQGYLSNSGSPVAATGLLNEVFYPLENNPSGYTISGAFISQSDLDSATTQVLSYVANNYYPDTNPSGYASSLTGSGAYYPLNSNPSGYITTGQTGNFGGGSFNTGTLVGTFYLNSNPSGYITGLNTGSFVTTGQTGSFITTGQTGNFGGGSFNTGTLVGTFVSVNGAEEIYGQKIFNPTTIFNNGILAYVNGYLQNYTGSSTAGQTTLDWLSRVTYDSSNNTSIDWQNRQLKAGSLTIVDWSNGILSGTWQAQGLTISGHSVVTGGPYYLNSNPSGYITTGQTGNFGGGSFNTGTLVGTFYLNSNPSGYITGVNTGSFVTTGQTGNFGFNSGSLVGTFSLNTGVVHITGNETVSGLKTFVSGIFSAGFSQAIKTQSSNYNLTNLDSSILFSGNNLTGTLPSAATYSGQVYNIKLLTGSLTITGAQKIDNSNTYNSFTTDKGISVQSDGTQWWVINHSPTGLLTGSFYPLTGNPSGYIQDFTSGELEVFCDGSIALMPGQGLLLDMAGSPILDGAGNYIYTPSSGNVGINNLNPQYTLDVSGVGNFTNGLIVSGVSVSTGLNNYIGNQQSFIYNVSTTGNNSYFVQFPFNFPAAPRVSLTLEITGTYVYAVAVSNRTISGFTALFSDIIQESGVSLDVFASLN